MFHKLVLDSQELSSIVLKNSFLAIYIVYPNFIEFKNLVFNHGGILRGFTLKVFLGFLGLIPTSFWSQFWGSWIFLQFGVLPFILEEISFEVDVIDSLQYDFHF